MTVGDVLERLDDEFCFARQDKWDNSGLLVGDISCEVKGVLTALDVQVATVEEAIERGCNLILSHHPVMLFGAKRLVNGHSGEIDAVLLAIKRDISIIAVHTPLDKHVVLGTSATLANSIGLEGIRPLVPEGKEGDYGYGIVGELGSEHTVDEFFELLKSKINLKVARYNNASVKRVKRVGVCTGSALEFARNAVECGCDAYITADVKYHQFGDFGDMLLVDIGHYESEVLTKTIFLHFIKNNFINFAHCYESGLTQNNIKYFIPDGK